MEFIGRLHPLILHLPIGFLVLAWLMECFSRTEKYKGLKTAVGFSLQLGMCASIAAAASGYVLSWEGGYEENLLFWHQWLGISTVIFSIALYLLHQRKSRHVKLQKAYFPAFTTLIFLLLGTGHYGGSLTHGSDFLTTPFSTKEVEKAITDLEEAIIFTDFIQPIFKKKCNSCHNESKQKGQLLLATVEGIQKGGESGTLFVPKQAQNSLMMQRIHLPLSEEEHMPPKGKTQLTKDEITLLTWWIDEGADFEKKVVATDKPEQIQQILNKYITPMDKGVLALEVEAARSKDVKALQDAGAKVYSLAQDSPFLSVDFSGKKNLTKQVLKKLSRLDEQLVYLDLSESNVRDEMLDVLRDLPHLQKLFLQKTAINGQGLIALKEAQYLEVLNLYQTQISDENIAFISTLPRLKKIFIWQTNVSNDGVLQLKKDRPLLEINTGINSNIFGHAQLTPPLIKADEEIFKDSLLVELDLNFKAANLYYTLDGSPPDSTSFLYKKPIVLSTTTDVKAMAWKAGWTSSEVVSKSYVRAKYQAKTIKLNKAPNKKYAAKGARSLGDFKKGTAVFTDGNWLGYQGSDFVATFDLGASVEVSRVIVSALEDTGSYIFFPKGLQVSISKNGKVFQLVSVATYPTSTKPNPTELRYFLETFKSQFARYVRIEVKSNLVNPAWHPAPSAPCWLFVDEILVE